MGEVLSQNEIDALLSALTSGQMDAEELKKEEEGRKVRVYDFKRALRFSKDQIRGLTRIHENFARLITTFYSAKLRTFVQISLTSADQLPYEEFIRSLPKMTVLNVFEVPPLEGRILLEVNPNVSFAMMDRILGGKGAGINKIDSITEIETKILSTIFEQTIENLRESWENITEINPMLTDFETNPQFLQMAAPNDTVIVISFNAQIGESSGMMNICIPHVVLEPIIPKLAASYWMQSSKKSRKTSEVINSQKYVQNTELPVVAELGSTVINVKQFLQINFGDTIQLDTEVSDPLLLKIGTIPKFTAQLGRVNQKMAVQILDAYREGESEIYDE